MVTPWVPSDTLSIPVIPYLTPGEYQAAGTAVDTKQLVPGGTATQETAALANRIMQASSFADQLCFQTLGATVEVETKSNLLVRSDCTVRVPVRFWPVLEVSSVSLGPSPSSMSTYTDLTSLWMQGRRVVVLPVSSVGPGGHVYVKITYVNGWACTTLGADAAAGATTLTVASTVGFYAGKTYRIHDVLGGPEQFTVQSVTNSTTLALVAGLTHAHTKPAAPDGITVSGLPDAVRAAVVELTSMLIRTRGDSSIVMASIHGEPSHERDSEPGAVLNLDTAMMLLHNFQRAAI